jgi:hypothetical protein
MEDNLPNLPNAPRFNLEREYYFGEAVIYEGVTYLATRAVSGEYPSSSSGWVVNGTSAILSEQIYQELSEQLNAITQSYDNTQVSLHDYPREFLGGGGIMWEVSTVSNTSSSLSDEVAGLRAEIHTLRSEIAQIKRELKVVRAKEEKEHRKLSV